MHLRRRVKKFLIRLLYKNLDRERKNENSSCRMYYLKRFSQRTGYSKNLLHQIQLEYLCFPMKLQVSSYYASNVFNPRNPIDVDTADYSPTSSTFPLTMHLLRSFKSNTMT